MIAQLLLVGLLVLFAIASVIHLVRVNTRLVLGIIIVALAIPAFIYSTHVKASNYNPTRAVNSAFSTPNHEELVRDYMRAQEPAHRLKAEHRERQVSQAIVKAARATDVDPNVLATFANIESTMNAKAKNGRIKGLLQFTPGTWKLMVKRHAKKHGIKRPDVYNAYHNALFGAELINDNDAWLNARLKRETSVEEKYLAHFISPLYALKMIKAGGWRAAKDIVPASFAQGNKRYFYSKTGRALSVREFRRAVAATLSAKHMEITQPTQVANVPVQTCDAPTFVETHPLPKRDVVSGCVYELWGDRRITYGVA